MPNKTPFQLLVVTALSLFITGCADMKTTDPAATADGLVKSSKSSFRDFYQKPGTDLTRFETIQLEACTVSFKENWMRRQNENRVDLSNRVRQEDADRITNNMSATCDKKLLAALHKTPPYTVVDHVGHTTLILRPAIVDLDVHAPDIRGSTSHHTYTQSSGEMTLNLDFIDGASGQLIARAVDKRRDSDAGYLERTTSVSNKADATIALLRWGNLLRETLQAKN